MNKMKSILFGLIGLIALIGVTGCEESADNAQKRATQESMKEAHSQIGMPSIKNFQERKLAKMIFELRDQENLTTYAYIVNLQGKLIFIGKCIGFGLPYSVQYTNPMVWKSQGATLPQPDPNGLFMPDGLSATWLMMYDPKTKKARPVYVEPEIIVSPFRLH